MQIIVQIILDIDKLEPTKYEEGIQGIVSEMLADGLIYLRELIPIASGTYHKSIKKSYRKEKGKVVGEIWADASMINKEYYPIFVEVGTKPHMPPLEPLVEWAKLKNKLSPKQALRFGKYVQMVIAKKGTKPQYIFEKTAIRLNEKYGIGKIDIMKELKE